MARPVPPLLDASAGGPGDGAGQRRTPALRCGPGPRGEANVAAGTDPDAARAAARTIAACTGAPAEPQKP